MLLAGAALTGCATRGGLGAYDAPASRPQNPENVRVKVSLKNRAVYVMEGDRPLLVTATAIGLPNKPTPTGNFRVFAKIAEKRSGSYGFWANGNDIRPGTSGSRTVPGGRYVGFPMAYWVEFAPGYGFHEGSVWPIPRTHGCLRLHKNVAPKFFALTKIGTPVQIAHSLPEDETLGRNLRRPQDYNDPDPPASQMISAGIFQKSSGNLFTN
jgi:lipoprotein-anchoring transpeptidase ErfK/SrfK